MSDPARLTGDQVRAHAVYGLALEVAQLKARLAAAENVVEAARAVSETSGSPHDALDAMYEALNVYDAQKEPTGNHAESSTTRGDTHE